MADLAGQSIVITGGSRGIGRGLVRAFAKAGADVIFTYVSNEAAANEVKAEVEGTGGKVIAMKADVTSAEAAQSVIDEAIRSFGKIDVLVNNAGVTRDTLLMRMSEADWDTVLEANLKGTFLITKAAIRPMMSAKKGKIIAISSVVGLTGNAGQANYAASKAGVIAFMKSVAKELASRNITANVIAPGYIETDMTGKLSEAQQKAIMDLVPLKRIGKTDDIANVALFLASSAADYITGETIRVDGGMAM
ncbi:MAG TPA: 3-oxoacyl-[acyl-carrier-protein] reductase [Candidatus Kapabacteria bacterium]|nr:3-oxoacyl-[acyl-carrier-protein] reductase [Candidatus Kapabacteria bacterium]